MNDVKVNNKGLVDIDHFILGTVKIIDKPVIESMIEIDYNKTMVIISENDVIGDNDYGFNDNGLFKKYLIPVNNDVNDDSIVGIIEDYKEKINFDENLGTIEINGEKHIAFKKEIWLGDNSDGKSPNFDTLKYTNTNNPKGESYKVLMMPSKITKKLYNEYWDGNIKDGDKILISCHLRGDDYYVNNPISYKLMNTMDKIKIEKESKISPENFTYWLRGMLEGESSLSYEEQIELIDEHLDLVFTKITKKKGLPHFC